MRRARPEESGLLTSLALRSKASNGYDAVFMAACVAELTLPRDRIASGEVWVAGWETEIVGYFELAVQDGVAEVMALFVEPKAKGTGIGRALWAGLNERARSLGANRIGVGSDPAALGFYERMGCIVVGTEPSGSIPGRVLPRLELPLEA
jgi:GNAT superfamily N-acetyltransferase